MIESSDAAADKLQAVLNHDFACANDDLGVGYVAACRTWFAALTARERTAANAAMVAFNHGSELDAEELLRDLPPAPRFPL